MKRCIFAVGAFAWTVLVSSAASASPILLPTSGAVIGSITSFVSDPSTYVYDVRGTATVEAFEQTTNADLGAGFLLGVSPFPESALDLVNSPTATELLSLPFDFATSAFSPGVFPGPTWDLIVTGAALTPPPVTDPVLSGFVGTDVAVFGLTTPANGTALYDASNNQIGTTWGYTLSAIIGTGAPVTVPEPATVSMLGLGLMSLVVRQRKKNQGATRIE